MSTTKPGNKTLGSILGALDANEFLTDYWQKKPLLIKSALSDLPSLSADELAGLALEDEIESRLVVEDQPNSSWQLHQGPFSEQTLQTLPPSHWTLLVQAVDQWLPEVHELLDHFNFLPRWRLDDIMVSLSAVEGSVGPHFDNYDVFLLQTSGQKTWRIGQSCDSNTPLITNAPLSLIEDFQLQQEYLLEPGDILYLPPQVAHWGISRSDNCITFSIGFRSPTAVELLDDLVTELLANPKLGSHPFTDPPLSTTMARGEIDQQFIHQVRALLSEQLSDDKLLGEWFARFMTARKYPELELITDEDQKSLAANPVEYQALSWNPASRYALLTRNQEDRGQQDQSQATLAVDGELYPTSQRLATLLSGQQQFSQDELNELNTEELALVAQLFNQGSLEILDGVNRQE